MSKHELISDGFGAESNETDGQKRRPEDAAESEAKRVKIVEEILESDGDSDSHSAAIVGLQKPSSRSPTAQELSTINRKLLDFSFEKLCSVSLASSNVYACLVCGKYFQGRGPLSYAYLHSVQNLEHHLFLDLTTKEVYELPDDTRLTSDAFDDILQELDPQIAQSNLSDRNYLGYVKDLLGVSYRPGYIGLNSVNKTSYINACIQILGHVGPIRDYLIQVRSGTHGANDLVLSLGWLMRKMWSNQLFKAHVSPHEFLQQVSIASKRKYGGAPKHNQATIEPFKFLIWFLNYIVATKNPLGDILRQCFQGVLQVETQFLKTGRTTTKETNFWVLSLEPPPQPLFKDNINTNAIPQVPLSSLLTKYSGSKFQELAEERRLFAIKKLPPYLLLHVNRFTKSPFGGDEITYNKTVVTFSATSNINIGGFDYSFVGSIAYDSAHEQEGWKVQLLNSEFKDWVEIENLNISSVKKELLFMSETSMLLLQRAAP